MIWALIAFAVVYILFVYWYVNKYPEQFKDDDDNNTPPNFLGY